MESPSGSSDDGGADPKQSSTTSTGDVSAEESEKRRTKRTIAINGLSLSTPTSTTTLDAALEKRLREKMMDGLSASTNNASEGDTNPAKKLEKADPTNYHRSQSMPTSTSTFEERLRRKMDEDGTGKEQHTPLIVGCENGQKNLSTSSNDDEGDVDAANKERKTLNHRSQSMPTSTSTFEERLQHKIKMDEEQRKRTCNDAAAKCVGNGDDEKSSLDELETFENRILQKNSAHQESHQEGSAILISCSDEKEDVKDAPSVGDEYGIINAQVQVSFKEPEQTTFDCPALDTHCPALSVSTMDFEDILTALQQLKRERGDLTLPLSHDFVMTFIEKATLCQKRSLVNEKKSGLGSNIDSGSSPLPSKKKLPRPSLLPYFPSQRLSVQATLVRDEEEGDVVEAEPLGLLERKWKLLAIPIALALSLLAILLGLTLTGVIDVNKDEPMNNKQPTLAPTFDPRETIEIIRERGYLQCGLGGAQITSPGFNFDLCRSVAAVVLGNPDSIKAVHVTTANRWQMLHDRSVDMIVSGDTHTIERQTKEPSTGVGFTFSSVYNYDGMVFYGNPDFVQCAEEFKRYDECSALKICVTAASTHYNFVMGAFPVDTIIAGSNLEEITELLFNGACNAACYDKSAILPIASSEEFIDKNFIIRNKMLTKEPLAMVTRNSDSELSDNVNWVLQALIYGEEHGLVKDSTLCQNSTDLAFTNPQDLNFMNAVYCVGNYGEIFDGDLSDRGMNQINNGTGGLFYSIPFGNLEKEYGVHPSSAITNIRNNGTLNCGMLVPGDFVVNVTNSTGLVGMGAEYCRALAAALFVGDYDSANLIPYRESTMNSSYVALANGDIDVLVGARVHKKFDFQQPPSLEGVHFSTPYYYGDVDNTTNEKSFFAIATSEGNPLFSSFVDTIVLATIYAQENSIGREKSREMPLVSVFGGNLKWALRDAIYYSGTYAEIYVKNFGSGGESEAHRGRNALNGGGPMLLSLPGL